MIEKEAAENEKNDVKDLENTVTENEVVEDLVENAVDNTVVTNENEKVTASKQ